MKKPNFAGNAVYAKVKCLYGKRLKRKEYSDMLSLRSVNEIAEYLKTKTSYSEIFEGLTQPNEWQRSQLENLLFNKFYNELESIIRFQKAIGRNLYEYFIMKYDADQIINVLSSLETKSNSYIFTFPVFYNERSHLDLYKLAEAKNEEDLLTAAEGTVYYETLRDALSSYRLTKNLTAVQSAFRNMLDREFIKLVGGKKAKKLSEKSEVGNLYKTLKDIHVINILYRLQRFNSAKDVYAPIKNIMLTSFTEKQLSEMLNAENTDELTQAIEKTYLAPIVKNANGDVFKSANEYAAAVLRNALNRSSDSDTVMFAYAYSAENEIKNIIHIIEGIRYGLTSTEIMPLLSGISPSN